MSLEALISSTQNKADCCRKLFMALLLKFKGSGNEKLVLIMCFINWCERSYAIREHNLRKEKE